jgi:hypothetical protein
VEDVDADVRCPRHHRLRRFEADRTPVPLEIPGPLFGDLARGHPLPRAGVGLAQTWIADHRRQPQRTGDDRRRLRSPQQITGRDRREVHIGVGGERAPDRSRLAASEVGERRIGDPLPPLHGVPLALAVPDEQQRTLATVHPERG